MLGKRWLYGFRCWPSLQAEVPGLEAPGQPKERGLVERTFFVLLPGRLRVCDPAAARLALLLRLTAARGLGFRLSGFRVQGSGKIGERTLDLGFKVAEGIELSQPSS